MPLPIHYRKTLHENILQKCCIVNKLSQITKLKKPAQQKKSYEVDFEKFEPFTSTEMEYFDPGTLRITRKGRNNFVISGDYTFMKNMGDESYVSHKRKPMSEFNFINNCFCITDDMGNKKKEPCWEF